MRYKVLALGAAILFSATLSAQPPKRKTNPPPQVEKPADNMIVSDTLKYVTDTSQMQYRIWVGENYESYLARVNGYLVRKAKVGKMSASPTEFFLFDFNWKALKPEDVEQELSKPYKWKK
jgi:hypothetical protein